MNFPIIDSHCHVYPDKIADKAVGAIGEFYDIGMYSNGRIASLVESGKEIGVSHYVIFSVATTPKQTHSINNFIAETVKNSGGIMTGLGTLHPDSENIEEEIEEIKALGLKGIKLHPDFQKFKADDPKCDKIYSLCEGTLPLLMHTGDTRYDFSNPDRVENILKKHKNLTLIGAHFGGWSCWVKAGERLSSYENFYVDCSSSFNWITPEESEMLIKKYTADKVLFATDYPMWSHKNEFDYFMKLDLTDEERKKILYKNAQKLFKIEKI